jgi:predicted acylesterase/phospholipase RssA/CRP-like cAMP-binding protein
MIEQVIPEKDLDKIVQFLEKVDLFKNLDKDSLRNLASSMSLVSVEGGKTLIHKGEYDSSLYILLQGRLRVFIKKREIADITCGQIVGEIAMLTDERRTSSVRAVRDSLLLKLDKENYLKFQEKHPFEIIEMAKTAIKRMNELKRATQIGENVCTIAVVPAGGSNHYTFARGLSEELKKSASTLFINSELTNQNFIDENLVINDDSLSSTWLQTLENQYEYLILETDKEMTQWTEMCLRQADRIIFVAEEKVDRHFNSIEKFYFLKNSEHLQYTEIVFIHPQDSIQISGTRDWLKLRPVDNYHHLKMGEADTYTSISHFITNKAFGVVLNGSGVRSFVHLGVLKALEELQIPVDYIGGSSFGSLIAAGYSCGLTTNDIINAAKEYVKKFYEKENYLPFTAPKEINEVFNQAFEDVYFEDLYKPFFCISTNITEASVKVHNQGFVWKAVLASMSLPGIFSPMYDDDNNMLVDGSVINNLPVDVMRKILAGGKILAVNCDVNKGERRKQLTRHKSTLGYNFLKKLNPFVNTNVMEKSDFDTHLATITISSDIQQKLSEKEADYILEFETKNFGLLDVDEIDTLIEIGYKRGIETLSKMLRSQEDS